MRVKFKLLQQGQHRHPYWWIIVQGQKKKLNGKYLEHVGIWAPFGKKTVPRQITINKHRVRYWLSVGATPTKGVQFLFEKHGFVPKRGPPFGSQH